MIALDHQRSHRLFVVEAGGTRRAGYFDVFVDHHSVVFDPREASPLLPQRSLVSGIRLVHDAILTR